MFEILTFVFAILAFVTALIVLFVFLFKKQKSNANQTSFDLTDIQNNQIRSSAEIKAAIENLEKNISLKM